MVYEFAVRIGTTATMAAPLQPLRYASLRLTTVRPGGRKKNDNQGSAGFVGNLDVPALPVQLLSIKTYVIPYCRDGVAVSGGKIGKHDPAIVGMNRKFCC